MYICCGKYGLSLVFAFAPRGFSPVLGYSTLLKSQHFEIQIRPGNRQTKNHLLNELLLNIYLFIYLSTWFGQSWKGHEFYQSSWKVLEFGLGPWIVLDFFIRSGKVLEIHNLVYARLFFFSVKLHYFTDVNLAHPRCKNLWNSRVAQKHFCAWTIFYFCSLFWILFVPQMQLQVIPSHFAKSCCGK